MVGVRNGGCCCDLAMSEKGLRPSAILRRPRKKYTRRSVLKMLAVMEAHRAASTSSNSGVPPTTPDTTNSNTQEFLTSGRTGRRNALPDILGEHALVTSSDLPSRLQSLTTTDVAGPSKQGQEDRKS